MKYYPLLLSILLFAASCTHTPSGNTPGPEDGALPDNSMAKFTKSFLETPPSRTAFFNVKKLELVLSETLNDLCSTTLKNGKYELCIQVSSSNLAILERNFADTLHRDKFRMQYFIGKSYEKLKNYDKAIEHLTIAGKARTRETLKSPYIHAHITLEKST